MIKKKVLSPERIRSTGKRFSFIPHQFLTGGFLEALSGGTGFVYFSCSGYCATIILAGDSQQWRSIFPKQFSGKESERCGRLYPVGEGLHFSDQEHAHTNKTALVMQFKNGKEVSWVSRWHFARIQSPNSLRVDRFLPDDIMDKFKL